MAIRLCLEKPALQRTGVMTTGYLYLTTPGRTDDTARCLNRMSDVPNGVDYVYRDRWGDTMKVSRVGDNVEIKVVNRFDCTVAVGMMGMYTYMNFLYRAYPMCWESTSPYSVSSTSGETIDTKI